MSRACILGPGIFRLIFTTAIMTGSLYSQALTPGSVADTAVPNGKSCPFNSFAHRGFGTPNNGDLPATNSLWSSPFLHQENRPNGCYPFLSADLARDLSILREKDDWSSNQWDTPTVTQANQKNSPALQGLPS